MALSIYPRSLLTQMSSSSNKIPLYKILPWTLAFVVIGLGASIIKSTISIFMMKLYEFFIEKNALKL